MIRPTTRVLTLLELLQAKGLLSGADIAERLGVDRRTVRRYISVLEDMGIPIMTEQGRYGGYRLIPGFKLPPLMFTEAEVQVIMLALLAVREQNFLDDNVAVESVQAKLQRVIPDHLKNQIQTINNSVQLIPSQQSSGHQHLVTLTHAVQSRLGINMVYQSPQGETMPRRFDPYGLVFRAGKWYVGGFCHLREDLRSFRLDRLSDITCTDEHFEPPNDFDAARHLQQSLYKAQRRYAVSVLFHADFNSVMAYMSTATSNIEDLEDLFVQDGDGVLLTTSTDDFQWFILWLARLPFKFVIKSPDELKTALNEHIQKLILAI
ncbi:helix-turn-helix transcriptional regulator [Thalassotalea agariperforans]